MAAAAHAIERLAGMFVYVNGSPTQLLDRGPSPSCGETPRRCSWSPRYARLLVLPKSFELRSSRLQCDHLRHSSGKVVRTRQPNPVMSWMRFCHLAQSHFPEIQGSKVGVESIRKLGKSRVQNIDAELGTVAKNRFSPARSGDGPSEGPKPPETGNHRTSKKTQERLSKVAPENVVGKTTSPRQKKKTGARSPIVHGRDTGDIKFVGDLGDMASGGSDKGRKAGGRAGSAGGGTTGLAERGTSNFLRVSTTDDIPLRQEDRLRLIFLESIMERSRNGDVDGVEEGLLEMEIAGLKPGPHAFHGLVVAYTRGRDLEGALQAFRRELTFVERPLPETFVALARLLGASGQAYRGEQILAAMEKLNHDPRTAWLVLVDELRRAGCLEAANELFLNGTNKGLRGTPDMYTVLIEENGKVGDHASTVDMLRALEYSGLQPTTSHLNCLLMCQSNANVPEIVASTFENMQYGPHQMRPDTDSYNWLLQAYVRNEEGDRCQEVLNVLGHMVEDHEHVQPNIRTFSLLVECFTKYCIVNEAVRHFRALSKISGGVRYLHNEGKNGDPLSLYLRAVCLEGRALDLLEALEAMVKDNQTMPPRAMLINQKGRTLISSWVDPIGAEANLGFDVDYTAKFLSEVSTGLRKRWSDLESRAQDNEGFAFWPPSEVSFKQHCVEIHRKYKLKLIDKLRTEGVLALGPGATEADVTRVLVRLRKETVGDLNFQPPKPKAASKMLVSELKEELEAQGLPAEGTRPVLYQRVQKARRINRSRGRPLWVPAPKEELEEEEDHSTDMFMKQLSLANDTTEFWRKRLMGEDQETVQFQGIEKQMNGRFTEQIDSDNGEVDGDDDDDGDDDNEEEMEEGAEETEDLAEEGGDDESNTPTFLALQLLRKKAQSTAEGKVPDGANVRGQWLGLTLEQKIAKVRNEKLLVPSEIYTIADVWGWTWENEIRTKEPEHWSQELEVRLGMQIMQRILELGGAPTIGDCATLVHLAMQVPWPQAILTILQQTHKLGFKFGSKLYSETVNLCIKLGEHDIANAIITNMADHEISAPDALITASLLDSTALESQEIS